jgi:hypothetical protein
MGLSLCHEFGLAVMSLKLPYDRIQAPGLRNGRSISGAFSPPRFDTLFF